MQQGRGKPWRASHCPFRLKSGGKFTVVSVRPSLFLTLLPHLPLSLTPTTEAKSRRPKNRSRHECSQLSFIGRAARSPARGRPKTKGREVHFKVDTAFLPSLPSLHSFLFDPSQLCCRLSRSLRQIRHPTNTQHNSNGSRRADRRLGLKLEADTNASLGRDFKTRTPCTHPLFPSRRSEATLLVWHSLSGSKTHQVRSPKMRRGGAERRSYSNKITPSTLILSPSLRSSP